MDISAMGRSTAPVYETGNRNKAQTPAPQGSGLLARLPRLDLLSGEALQAEKADFAEAIGNYFREAGINVPPEPVLRSDWQGAIRVANNHPDKAGIEQIFQDHPEMQQRFARISGAESLARAAEHHKAFMQEYERLHGNVAAQQALVDAEVARNKAPYFMTVTNDGIEGFFGLGRASA
jgi:hypothetical protein